MAAWRLAFDPHFHASSRVQVRSLSHRQEAQGELHGPTLEGTCGFGMFMKVLEDLKSKFKGSAGDLASCPGDATRVAFVGM